MPSSTTATARPSHPVTQHDDTGAGEHMMQVNRDRVVKQSLFFCLQKACGRAAKNWMMIDERVPRARACLPAHDVMIPFNPASFLLVILCSSAYLALSSMGLDWDTMKSLHRVVLLNRGLLSRDDINHDSPDNVVGKICPLPQLLHRKRANGMYTGEQTTGKGQTERRYTRYCVSKTYIYAQLIKNA